MDPTKVFGDRESIEELEKFLKKRKAELDEEEKKKKGEDKASDSLRKFEGREVIFIVEAEIWSAIRKWSFSPAGGTIRIKLIDGTTHVELTNECGFCERLSFEGDHLDFFLVGVKRHKKRRDTGGR